MKRLLRHRSATAMVVACGLASALPAIARESDRSVQHPVLHLGKPIASAQSRAHARRRVPHAYVNARLAAERIGYKSVSSLVPFPAFFPGLGVVYVKPSTLPNGPFLCFDRRDRLMSTVYMIPVTDFQDHKKFDFTRMSRQGDHVTLYFNGGHPGVTMPHYHVVVWHVPKQAEALVAK